MCVCPQEIKAREMEELARTLAELGIEAPQAAAEQSSDTAAADGAKKKKKKEKKAAKGEGEVLTEATTNGNSATAAAAAQESSPDEEEEAAATVDPAEVRKTPTQHCTLSFMLNRANNAVTHCTFSSGRGV